MKRQAGSALVLDFPASRAGPGQMNRPRRGARLLTTGPLQPLGGGPIAKASSGIVNDEAKLFFRQTVLAHLDAAYNLARWLVRNEHDAEDLVQEALLRAFRHFDASHVANPRPWLLAIVRNTCFTWLKRHRAFELLPTEDGEEGIAIESSLVAPSPNPEQLFLEAESRRHLDRLLERLPPEFREIVILREIEECSYKEIAAIIGVPIGTVMSRLARARRLLRRHWEEAGLDGPS
jgi:RNA polymerase sigma-70 factor (ECF subfamily)